MIRTTPWSGTPSSSRATPGVRGDPGRPGRGGDGALGALASCRRRSAGRATAVAAAAAAEGRRRFTWLNPRLLSRCLLPAVEIRGGPKTIKVRRLCRERPEDARAGSGSRTARGLTLNRHQVACPLLPAPPRPLPLLPQKLTSTQNVEDNGITWVEQLSL